MGLAGPRNRRKLQHDPNNTKWSRDETTFGQKILRAHGWEPGKFLGAQNASHSHLHTAASAAPINVLLKDDTMGLGAKPRHKQNTECTGLDVFKDLLGRLNGKSEEVIEKEKRVKSEVKTCLYVERKYGSMRFVSGGLLVGDQMAGLTSTTTKAETPTEDVKDEDIKEESTTLLEDVPDRPVKKQKKEKKSKKRKAEDVDSTDETDAVSEKKRKKQSKDDAPQDDLARTVEAESSSKKKKSKKSKRNDTEGPELLESEKKKKSKKPKKDAGRETENDDSPILSEETGTEKSKSKKEKKEKHKKDKKQKQSNSSTDVSTLADTPTPTFSATPQESGTSTPIETGTSTPRPLSGRHLARSRHIASKRMAIADLQAMNQIFMVKPV
ncbi:Protein PXR1 [Daldinia childiae]|uniref:Protein PXR1 n=1 Tax=Daldinia childiae TaxID=326645 RepID=UPI0014466579|nr:Protein PXR1 [Daldinia childiae]KAF3055619.1 Protein PXR1 [Daldinia childiae]